MYARAVVLLPSHDNERAAAARLPQTHRRRSATGPGRDRGLAAIREQGRVVADYWTTLKARKR